MRPARLSGRGAGCARTTSHAATNARFACRERTSSTSPLRAIRRTRVAALPRQSTASRRSSQGGQPVLSKSNCSGSIVHRCRPALPAGCPKRQVAREWAAVFSSSWQAHASTRDTCVDPYVDAWAGVEHPSILEKGRLRDARAARSRRACSGCRAARSEQAEGAGVAVQERGAVHRTDLAVAEEAAERDVAGVPAERVRVVIRLAVEMLAAPEAGEEQRARRASPSVAAEQLARGRRPTCARRAGGTAPPCRRATQRTDDERAASCRRCPSRCGSGSRPAGTPGDPRASRSPRKQRVAEERLVVGARAVRRAPAAPSPRAGRRARGGRCARCA